MTRRTRIAAAFAAARLSAGVCIATLLEVQRFEVLFGSASVEGEGRLETESSQAGGLAALEQRPAETARRGTK